MNKNIEYILLLLLAIPLVFGCQQDVEDTTVKVVVENQITKQTNRISYDDVYTKRIQVVEDKAKEALGFCKSEGYNIDFCILVDMTIHSGKHRMFVYDFNKQTIEHKALCAHGSGKDDKRSTTSQPVFSNEEGSLLSSLGKYKIGIRSYSQWGINVHYKLHGLEETNNNAYKRIVVLHSYTPVSEEEIYPSHLPLGWSHGCPVTDDETMRYLDAKLKKVTQPVLLWIYYDEV